MPDNRVTNQEPVNPNGPTLCGNCNGILERIQVPCPDSKKGCIVLHTKLSCSNCDKPKNRPEDQPMPTTSENSKDVQKALVRMILARRALGIQRYGSSLMTHNGRDALRDALEEAVDLAAYLMQLEMEEQDRKNNFDGGEQWQEEFATQPIFDLPNLVHKVPGCKWSLEIVVENLREQLQLCYNHLEECSPSAPKESGK